MTSCSTLMEFRQALADQIQTDAICVTEATELIPENAIRLVREYSSAPVVLFRVSSREYDEAPFALVVQSLTHPGLWLQDLRTLILGRFPPVKSHCRELIEKEASSGALTVE